jgi:hypothetical protein
MRYLFTPSSLLRAWTLSAKGDPDIADGVHRLPGLRLGKRPLLRFEWVELDERCPAGRGQGRAKPGGANP